MFSKEDKTKKHRARKGLHKISFETEVITKDVAKQALHETETLDSLFTPKKIQKSSKLCEERLLSNMLYTKTKKRKKEKKATYNAETNTYEQTNIQSEKGNSELVKKQKQANVERELLDKQNEDNEISGSKSQKGDSKRAKKRRKHEELLLQKRKKVDVETREKCLNYLLQWKHNRNDWKFEKLRQIWLQQNIFDFDKIPDECWDTLLEYFESSKGNIKQKIIDEAIKLIEQDELNNETAESQLSKIPNNLKRARDIIQYLNV